MIDYALILSRRFRNSEWALSGDSYDGLTWLSAGSAPSKNELDAMWDDVRAEVARERRELERRAAFQAEADPVFFKWQRGEASEQDWIEAVERVRNTNPYEEA